MTPAALQGRALAVVDVEGNGARPPEIVEIAVLPLEQPPDLSALRTWLVRPRAPISLLLTRRVHGIGDEHVADAPRWAEVAPQVRELLQGRVLVAHNAPVEHRVLTDHLPGWRPPLVLDTLRLARRLWPGLPDGYSLERCVAHARLDTRHYPGARHRADYDTWATAALLTALVRESGLDWDGLVEAAALPGTAAHTSTDTDEKGLW